MLAPLGDVRARRMFGGHGIYLDGLMFALIADEVLYFRADDRNRPSYEALGLQPFKPFDDKPMRMPYYPPPESAMDDTGELLAWARPAFEAALRAGAKKKKKAPTD